MASSTRRKEWGAENLSLAVHRSKRPCQTNLGLLERNRKQIVLAPKTCLRYTHRHSLAHTNVCGSVTQPLAHLFVPHCHCVLLLSVQLLEFDDDFGSVTKVADKKAMSAAKPGADSGLPREGQGDSGADVLRARELEAEGATEAKAKSPVTLDASAGAADGSGVTDADTDALSSGLPLLTPSQQPQLVSGSAAREALPKHDGSGYAGDAEVVGGAAPEAAETETAAAARCGDGWGADDAEDVNAEGADGLGSNGCSGSVTQVVDGESGRGDGDGACEEDGAKAVEAVQEVLAAGRLCGGGGSTRADDYQTCRTSDVCADLWRCHG